MYDNITLGYVNFYLMYLHSQDGFCDTTAILSSGSVAIKFFWEFAISSAADWRYAADQFVKNLPDKVIVHRK